MIRRYLLRWTSGLPKLLLGPRVDPCVLAVPPDGDGASCEAGLQIVADVSVYWIEYQGPYGCSLDAGAGGGQSLG